MTTSQLFKDLECKYMSITLFSVCLRHFIIKGNLTGVVLRFEYPFLQGLNIYSGYIKII